MEDKKTDNSIHDSGKSRILLILFGLIAAAALCLAVAFAFINKEPEAKAADIATPTPEATAQPTPTPQPTPHPIFSKKETDGGLGPEIFQPGEYQGYVETITYRSTDYANNVEAIKSMRVYVPYGYSDDTKYDVLVLLHGYGGDEFYWFDRQSWYNDPDYCQTFDCKLANMLDNMIANKLCRPLIVVSPTYYLNDTWREDYYDDTTRDAYQFRKELRNDILPALAENYSIYDIGDRDHFAFIGASNGSAITYKGILPYALDLFSYFGAVSGCEGSVHETEYIWSKQGYDDYDIKFFYTSAGENDFLREESYNGYLAMKKCSKINDDNISYVLIRQAKHDDIVWIDAIYNCLQIFFLK